VLLDVSDGDAFARPQDEAQVTPAEAIEWQRDYVEGAGAPVAALILEATLAELAAGTWLRSHFDETVRFGDLVGLRVMAAVHRLALERRAPRVALHLPTLGGRAPSPTDRRAFAGAVVEALKSHQDVLAASLRQTPQTNEVGRSALLRSALSRLGPSARVRLREIGCSAGLNLRADRLPGDPALERGPMPFVIDRIGCDLKPVDPTSVEGRIHLTSYVWVDDVDRFERLRRAFTVAQAVPAVVVRREAGDFVESLTLEEGATTVLWHSAMWLYLTEDSRRRVRGATKRLGLASTHQSPFVHASWEWAREPADRQAPFELVVRTWDGGDSDGQPVLVATGSGHGAALASAGDVVLDGDPLEP
jgi:hypothetical protein